MEVLSQIVRSLLVIIMIASFLEIILPDSALRPYIRFAIGMFIVLAILNPVATMLFKNRELETAAWELSWAYNSPDEIQREGRELNKELARWSQESVESKVGKQVEALAGLIDGVKIESARVEMDADTQKIKAIELSVHPEIQGSEEGDSVQAFSGEKQHLEAGHKAGEKLVSLLSNLYGVEARQIKINWEGN